MRTYEGVHRCEHKRIERLRSVSSSPTPKTDRGEAFIKRRDEDERSDSPVESWDPEVLRLLVLVVLEVGGRRVGSLFDVGHAGWREKIEAKDETKGTSEVSSRSVDASFLPIQEVFVIQTSSKKIIELTRVGKEVCGVVGES